MNELSLFTGAGGGILGSKILGHRIIGYVEYEKYCQEIIKQRISDGILDAAPIFGDIRRFISDGFALAYQGMAEIITGGFPCQPFSVAGKGLGESDLRNMWPSTIQCIRIIRPPYVFLENVPGLLTDKYMGRIFGDLAESGYSFRWACLGADDVGANHRRKRLWILAYSNSGGWGSWRPECAGQERITAPIGSGSSVAHARQFPQGSKISGRNDEATPNKLERCGKALADAQGQRLEGRNDERNNGKEFSRLGKSCGTIERWWKSEPNVGRVAHGVASRVDRLKAIGNGQVPLAMAYAFSKLSEGIIE